MRTNVSLLIFFMMLCHMTVCPAPSSPPPDKDSIEFTFWVVGSGGVNARFGTNIYQAMDRLRENGGRFDEFLFTIAEEPLTMNQIRERSHLTRSQVEYFIARLDSCNIIKKFEQNRWATTLPVITDRQSKMIKKDLAPMANSVARYLKKEIQGIRALYDKVKSPLDPSWENISHLIIDKFIIDGTFHHHLNRLKRERDAGKQGGGKISVIPAYFVQKGKNYSKFGCNWYKFRDGDDQREVYVLHGAILDRYDIAMNRYRRNEDFSALLFKISADGKTDALADEEKGILRDLDWLSGERLSIPIVKADTVKGMWPIVERVGRDAAKIAFARFKDITDSYNNSTHSKFLDHREDYIQVLIHSLFGLTIEHLVKIGVVPHIPKPVSKSVAVYIVWGQLF